MISLVKKIITKKLLNQTLILPGNTDLANQVIIITGASRGVGLAIAKTLLSHSAKLVAVSRKISDLKAVFDESDPNLFLVEADVAQETAVTHVIKEVVAKFGRIDTLINGAAIIKVQPFEKMGVADYNKVLDTNLKGYFLMISHCLPYLKQSQGLVINIGSRISHNSNPHPGLTLYSASKYAVEGLSSGLSKELKKHHIRVTCLMPGTINSFPTPKSSKLISPYQIGELISFIIKASNIDFESIQLNSSTLN